MKLKRKYGWTKDSLDARDLPLRLGLAPTALPKSVDLRPFCPAVYDQGTLGSCTANAIGAAHQFEQMKQVQPTTFQPSRLFIYYNERVIEKSVEWDDGAQIRDGMKSLAKQGVCPESQWPYIIGKFAVKPDKTCYKSALDHQALRYMRVAQTEEQIKTCLAAGFPVVFGFSVYSSFESDYVKMTGKVPMPNVAREKLLGGHAVLCVGYSESGNWIVRNSWGPRWGDRGYCYFPRAYLLEPDMASDFWCVQLVEG